MLKRAGFVLAGVRLRFLGVLAFGITINGVFAVADPIILKTLVDRGLVQKDFQAFVLLALAVVLFAVLIRIGLWAYELASQRLRNDLTETLSLRLLRAYYDTDFVKVKKGESGYFLSRIYDEPAKVAQGAVTAWIGLATQLIVFLAAASVACWLSWKITLLMSLLVPPLYYLAHRFGPRITQASKNENEEEAQLRNVLQGAVSAYTTVKMFSLLDRVHQRTREQLQRFLQVLFSRVKTAKTFQMYSAISLSVAEALVLITAGYGVVSGQLTLGGLFGFMNAFWKLIGAATSMISLYPELSKLDGYLQRLMEFGAGEASTADIVEDRAPGDGIEIRDMTAGYNSHLVFERMNLQIRPGEKVLIVGPNGSGKSTLAFLLTQFLKPSEGTVRVPSLDRVSALLSPSPFIPGTLKDNVGFEDLDESQRRFFWLLAEELDLADKADRIPSEFSQGQQKKAQVLMALLKDADIYIFDEPLANIDSETKETILRRQLDRAKGRTLISIMHGDEALHSRFERIIHLPGRTRDAPSPPESEPKEDTPV